MDLGTFDIDVGVIEKLEVGREIVDNLYENTGPVDGIYCPQMMFFVKLLVR